MALPQSVTSVELPAWPGGKPVCASLLLPLLLLACIYAILRSMRVQPTFVSCGVNRVVNALDWGPNGLIAYAGHWLVCIYDPEVSHTWS